MAYGYSPPDDALVPFTCLVNIIHLFRILQEAIVKTADRQGTSRPTIKKYILTNYKGIHDGAQFTNNVANAIKKGHKDGLFLLPKGKFTHLALFYCSTRPDSSCKGIGGRVKLADKAKKAPVKKVAAKKPATAKKATTTKTAKPKKTTTTAAKKAPTVKKTVAKKPAAAKKTTTTAKKPAVKKVSKAKKPAVKKTATKTAKK